MFAGIYDPRGAADPAREGKRLEQAFGGASRAITAGPLAVISDGQALGRAGDARCLLEGSIFNIESLREQLGAGPGASVPDMLAQAYAARGEAMLEGLRGAFVLVAWTGDADRVLIAQDQVGVRALFLHRSGGELAFASEVCDLLPLLPRRPAPDEAALARWLNLAWLGRPQTLYEGVHRLGAGRLLAARRGSLEERRYWAPEYRPPLEGSRLEIAKELQVGLVRAVEARTAGVGTVGLMMSGGFDSSSVAAAAGSVRRDDERRLRGYSAVFPDDPDMDERGELDVLRRAVPLDNVRYHVKPGGLLTLCLAWVDRWALPPGGPGYAVERALTRRAADDGVEVLLDGQGGDEIFGFAIYLLADYLRRGRLLGAVDLARHGFPGSKQGAPWPFVRTFLKDYGLRGNLPHPLYKRLRRMRKPEDQVGPWLSERSARLYFDSVDDLAWVRGRSGLPRWWSQLATTLVDDREASGLGDYVRQRSAWMGMETRPPLFDQDLIDLALRIPPEFGFDSYLDRPLAREAMAGLLPDELRLSRRKSNLAPLHISSYGGPDLEPIRELLSGDDCEIFAYTRRDVIRSHLDKPRARTDPDWSDWVNLMFVASSVEGWLRSQSDPTFPRRFIESHGLHEPDYEDLSP